MLCTNRNLHTGDAHNYWGASATRYVDAFMDNVHWEEGERRAAWARQAIRARSPSAPPA